MMFFIQHLKYLNLLKCGENQRSHLLDNRSDLIIKMQAALCHDNDRGFTYCHFFKTYTGPKEEGKAQIKNYPKTILSSIFEIKIGFVSARKQQTAGC
jgi:hypothetical protein